MTPKKENQLGRDHPPDSRLDELRGLAEDILRRRPREAVQPEDDRVLELIHELEVHQIELRLQNEELIATQEDLARTSERYQDLFEFAPVGYLIFDQNGKVTEANLTLAMMLEQERQYLLKFGLSPFLDPENLSRLVRHRQQVLEKGAAEPCELKFTPKDLPVKWVHLDSRPIRDESERITGCRSTLTDITARKKLEEERKNTLELIDLVKNSTDAKTVAWRVTSFFRKWLNIEAVGLRLKEGDDYPYFETQGLPKGFVAAENHLCATDGSGRTIRDDLGNPVLECMCGNVISGRFDPDQPFFTQNGSFWTNSTTALLASTTVDDRQARTRNRCHGEGYESVALIPLRASRRSLGLLQLNDTRPDRFTPEMMAMLERLTDQVAPVLAEQQAREAERIALAERNNILATTSDGFMLLDPAGRFIDVNEAVCQKSGYSREELLALSLEDVLVEEEAEEALERFWQIAANGTERFEKSWRCKDGAIVDLEISLTRPSELEGKAVLFARDITRRKLVEKERMRLESQLHQSEKMASIGTLAGGVAHEFNNILAVIMGYTELALDEARAGKTTPDELKIVLESAKRARDLVKQILIFSHKDKSVQQPLDINKVVTRSLGFIEKTLPKMVEVSLNLSKEIKMTKADPNQLEQVMVNLCSNAYHAMPDGGSISIKTESMVVEDQLCTICGEAFSGEYILLSVSDNGVGMGKAILKQMFDPFFTTKIVGEGTGLGLSVVHGIVVDHDGHITCESVPGQGTTFHIYLPAIQATDEADTSERVVGVEISSGQETILLVDDEGSIRDLGKLMLTRKGYRVLLARTGEEALEIYREKGADIDLIVLDVSMPGMGGSKCLQELLKINPKARVVISSGYSSEGQSKDIESSGAVGFVPKPFSQAEMLKTVRDVLDV